LSILAEHGTCIVSTQYP